jgi:hypothetical protein
MTRETAGLNSHRENRKQAETKFTTSVYASRNLIERVKARNPDLSRIMEKALASILDYAEPQNSSESSIFLSPSSFQKESGGPVVQSGMNAAFAMRKSWVQIPPGPLPFGFKSPQRNRVNQTYGESLSKKRFETESFSFPSESFQNFGNS